MAIFGGGCSSGCWRNIHIISVDKDEHNVDVVVDVIAKMNIIESEVVEEKCAIFVVIVVLSYGYRVVSLQDPQLSETTFPLLSYLFPICPLIFFKRIYIFSIKRVVITFYEKQFFTN